jgi:hypothetical protein
MAAPRCKQFCFIRTRKHKRTISQILDHPLFYATYFNDGINLYSPSTRGIFLELLIKFPDYYDTPKIPADAFLKGIKLTKRNPVALGGFANVYIGSYNSQDVALKHLRMSKSWRGPKTRRSVRVSMEF